MMRHNWITKKFLSEFKAAIVKDGFVSNEHLFTPYRETMVNNVNNIKKELDKFTGKSWQLETGETHSINGKIFYVFEDNGTSPNAMKEKVTVWVNNQYEDE